MHKTIQFILLVSIIGGMLVSDARGDPNDIGKYSIVIGNRPIDKTSPIPYKFHDPLEHRITVYVNGNPAYSINASGVFLLFPFIKPGINTIEIVSDGPQHVEAMATAATWNFVVKDRKFIQYDPNEQNAYKCDFVFPTYIRHEYPYFLQQNQLPQRPELIQKGVLDLLKTIFRLVEKQKYTEVAKYMVAGFRLWFRYVEGYQPRHIENYIQRLPELCNNDSLIFQQFEPEKYVILSGKNLILVYRKDGENVLFKSKYSDSPTVIAYIDGKYIIWYCAPD
jgi:hypothetical protein